MEEGNPEFDDRGEPCFDAAQAQCEIKPNAASEHSQGFWRRTFGPHYGWGVYGTLDHAVLLRSRDSGREWLWPYGSRHGADAKRSQSLPRRYGRQAAARS